MIVLINPNSTVSMTQAMLGSARRAAPSCYIEGWTSHDGPPAIQGEQDGVLASGPLLKLVAKASDKGARAIIIACSDDTSLETARASANCPVIGIGQAAYHLAALAGPKFSVVTTLPISVPILEANIKTYGLAGSLGRVRASDVPVLALEKDPRGAADQVIAEVTKAAQEDGISSVVLGCGGMVDVAARAAQHARIRVIDGVRAAACCAAQF